MPCLNGMPHLPCAIESVRKHFPAESVEIVVADGGSTDGSLDYLRGAGVILLEGPDTSLYDGLNRAVLHARGTYVAWLNSDDSLLEAMAQLLQMARENGADMATGEAEITSQDAIGWRSDHHRRAASMESVLFGVPSVNSRIFARRMLERAGPFRVDIGLGADRHMLLRLLRFEPRRLSHPMAVCRYRSHERSRTMAATWRSYRDVHAAHLAMVAALSAEDLRPGECDVLAAFECVRGFAAARASLLNNEARSGLASVLATVAHHPRPSRWLRGMRLHYAFRGLGSGW